MPSGGSNQTPFSPVLKDSVLERSAYFKKENFIDSTRTVPVEMLYASGSGLDPDISTESALLQVRRIQIARHLTDAHRQAIESLIKNYARNEKWRILNRNRINTVVLNNALDSLIESWH
jgi:K+-transporting ATPase ATPase C chain